MKQFRVILLVVLFVLAVSLVAAHDEPTVEVSDQVSLNGWVTVSHVTSQGPGFIVIHKDNGEGGIGPVIGYRWVNNGESNNVSVRIDLAEATPMLFAMLHADTGEVGVYEFGTVEGADAPVIVNDAPVSPPFTAEIMVAYDQYLDGSNVTVANVVTAANGWLVIHADNGGQPGPVLGQTAVTAGNNANVVVALSGDVTPVLWPMMHVDTGEAGVYEFGTVEGADGPVVVNGVLSTASISTGVPSVRMFDQVAVYSDGMEMMSPATVTAVSVVSEGPGWLVIHADNGGQPGPVLGQTAVADGSNWNVAVELSGDVTPVVWPMLHVDTGEVGTYEFGTVEGADGPVRVNDAVLTFAISIAPSINYTGTLTGTSLVVNSAQIDQQGFLVIHADNGGQPGPVLGYAPLVRGNNSNIVIELSGDITPVVYPMLHVDSGEPGVYEFGTVEGADGPVSVAGAVVTGPMTPEAGE
jgi:hypothetical protein